MRFLPAVLCFALLLMPAGASRAQSTTDTVYHLHGSVLNGVTGRPIGRALVVSQDRRLATMTNAEGQFTLDVSVPAAQAQAAASSSVATNGLGVVNGTVGSNGGGFGSGLILTAQRPGYLQLRQGTSITLDATAGTRNILVRLMPSASIHGQVAANGTEGLRGVRVELLRRSVQDGRFSWQMASARPVGTDGSFAMTDLQPGEYTLATAEWAPARLSPMGSSAITQQYPPDFLGDTRTLDGATKLHLGYGQNAQATLHLRAVPYYPVTIPLQGLPAGSGANVRVAAGGGFQMYQLGWNPRDGAVEGALPDGDYLVILNAPNGQGAGAQVPIHVAGAAVTHAPVGLTPTQDIPVIVRDERTQANTVPASITAPNGLPNPGVLLFARSEDANLGGGGTMQTTPGGPALRNLMPGRYFLKSNVMGRGYIASMTSDGVDLLTQALVVNEGRTAPVEITLRDDAGTITGTVDLRSGGLQTARVLVLPTDGSGRVLNAYVTSAGTFQVGNVPPGSYRAFATAADGPETLAYRDPEAMRAYDGKGGAVSVTAGQTSQVQAELVEVHGAGGQP